MKVVKIIMLIALAFNGLAVQAACHPAAPTEQNVWLFIDIPDANGDEVRWQQGTLSLQSGFIPQTSSDTFLGAFDLTPAVLAQVNGQTVMSLASWTSFENANLGNVPPGTLVCNFSRSAAAYSIESVPYVSVTVNPGGGNGGGGGAFIKNPKVSISAVTPFCSETAGTPCQFMITLSGPVRKTTRVRFSVDGKATRNKDYIRFPNSVAIPSGNVSAIVEVIPVDDTQREGTENVKVKLLPNPAYKLKRASATVQITDND